MQCPNCGKEAINVNGKYVCLDCGVEINKDTDTSEAAKDQSAVVNHGENLQNQNNNPKTEPNQIPEPEVSKETEVETVTNEDTKPIESLPALSANEESKAASEPVKDFYLETLGKMSGGVETVNSEAVAPLPADSADSNDIQNASPVPDFPPTEQSIEGAQSAPLENPASQPEVPSTPNPIENSSDESIPASPIEPIQPATNTPNPAEGLVPEQPSNIQTNYNVPQDTAASSTVPEPSQEVDTQAQPAAAEPAASNLDDILNKYAGPAPAPAENTLSQPLAARSAVSEVPVANNNYVPPEQAQPSYVPPSSVDSVQPATQEGAPIAVNPEPQAAGQVPNANAIPPMESVFGPQQEASPQAPIIDQQELAAKSNARKKIIIIVAVVVGIILLIGLIFLGVSLFGKSRNGSGEQPIETDEEVMFDISQKVARTMDVPQKVVVNFNQSVDFSKVTVKKKDDSTQNTDALRLLFSSPVTSKGNWQGNEKGDFYYEGSNTNLAEKKIFIADEKATYNQAAGAGNWSKGDGLQIVNLSPFYPLPNKGSLFYLTRADKLEKGPGEDIGGKTYQKVTIVPQQKVIEELLSNANPALSQTNYESINLSNLQVTAWLDDAGKIVKVTSLGDIGVNADLYEGTVSVKAEAKYEYKDVNIVKPEVVS